MTMPRWDPDKPVPPDQGGGHTHEADRIEVSVARAGGGNSSVPEGDWALLVTLTPLRDVPGGHAVAIALSPETAREIAQSLVQAAGDLEDGRGVA